MRNQRRYVPYFRPERSMNRPDVVLEIAFFPELRLLVKYFADSGTRDNIVDYKRPYQWRCELGIRASRRPVLHFEASSTTETSIFGAL